MCRFWPFRKRKPAIKENAMTIENAIAMLRAKIAAVVNAYNRMANENAALKAQNASLNAENAELAASVVALANDIPSLDTYEPSNQ